MTLTLHLKRCVCFFILLLSFQQIFSQDKNDTLTTLPNGERVFSKVEVEASFPGGDAAWNKYIANGMKNGDFDNFKNKDQGTCRVRFIVGKDGYVNNVQAITMKKTRLAKLAVEIIENSPGWKPAMQNGKAVNAYREQPITLTLVDEKK
jgi:Gram-negative bacterial tonB protein.